MDYKKTNAPTNTVTRDMVALSSDTGNIYETVCIIAKRANQIAVEMKTDLEKKLQEFASCNDNLEEVFENREQIEISRYYEKLPKPDLIATQEYIEGKIYYRKAFFSLIIRLKVLVPKSNNILPRYIFHALSSIKIESKSSSVPNMNASDVKRIAIPMPSVEKQAYIVEILDKFDALTTSITEGLPREIELRQKQYEYYRDALLSFPKPDNINE